MKKSRKNLLVATAAFLSLSMSLGMPEKSRAGQDAVLPPFHAPIFFPVTEGSASRLPGATLLPNNPAFDFQGVPGWIQGKKYTNQMGVTIPKYEILVIKGSRVRDNTVTIPAGGIYFDSSPAPGVRCRPPSGRTRDLRDADRSRWSPEVLAGPPYRLGCCRRPTCRPDCKRKGSLASPEVREGLISYSGRFCPSPLEANMVHRPSARIWMDRGCGGQPPDPSSPVLRSCGGRFRRDPYPDLKRQSPYQGGERIPSDHH